MLLLALYPCVFPRLWHKICHSFLPYSQFRCLTGWVKGWCKVRLSIRTERFILDTSKPQHLTPACSKQHCKGIRSSGGQAELVEMTPSFRDLDCELAPHRTPLPVSCQYGSVLGECDVFWKFSRSFSCWLGCWFLEICGNDDESSCLLSREE